MPSIGKSQIYCPQCCGYEIVVYDCPEMDGWMTWDFTSFLTVFQSCQDDVRMMMEGCVQMELRLRLRRFHLERGSNLIR